MQRRKTTDDISSPSSAGGVLFRAEAPQGHHLGYKSRAANCYKTIRDDVEALIRSLRTHEYEETYFYATRSKDLPKLTPVQRASRFIYLNKTCFNGLYRENSSGQFNAPFGSHGNPNIVDKNNLRAVSNYLSRADVKVHCRDYRAVIDEAKAGDFVYFDPPYIPMSATASFTKYTGADFGEVDQRALAATFAELVRKNVLVMLSNSNTPIIHALYGDFRIQTGRGLQSY
jgi:DNA adenine methylase